jgi:dTDP-glucose 4,6-dehydratase
MPKALVTGGAGFLGSHLCDKLMAEGYEVVVMDNLITGNVANIAHLLDKPGFQFVQYDVTNYLFVDGPLDIIFHAASPASPVDYLEKPIQTLKVGSLGTHKALGLARAKGCRFLMFSTSEIYGDPDISPQPEEYWGNVNTIGARGVYDEAKRFSEAMTFAYRRFHNVDAKIVRIFNTYGPRMRLAAWCPISSPRRSAANRSPSTDRASKRARSATSATSSTASSASPPARNPGRSTWETRPR